MISVSCVLNHSLPALVMRFSAMQCSLFSSFHSYRKPRSASNPLFSISSLLSPCNYPTGLIFLSLSLTLFNESPFFINELHFFSNFPITPRCPLSPLSFFTHPFTFPSSPATQPPLFSPQSPFSAPLHAAFLPSPPFRHLSALLTIPPAAPECRRYEAQVRKAGGGFPVT